MEYDIRNVGYEFMIAEELYQLRQYKEALEHYNNAIKHYEYADNIWVLSDAPYQITEDGITTYYPSTSDMVSKAHSRISIISVPLKWDELNN